MMFQLFLISLIGQVASEVTLWDGGVFHYNFKTRMGSETFYGEVASVFKQLSSETCLLFANSSNYPDRVEFAPGSASPYGQGSINIGKLGGVQQVGQTNQIGSFTRNLLISLGKTPELLRSDRDSFIPSNAKKSAFNGINVTDYEPSYPFDWGSATFDINDLSMWSTPHVDPYFFSTGSVKPSFYDIKYLNEVYGCLDKCSQSTTICQNGGYPNPNNCEQCICPPQFEGPNCQAVPWNELTATSEWQTYEGNLTNNFPCDAFATQKQVIWVNAPEGKTIQFAPKSILPTNTVWEGYTAFLSQYPRNPNNIQFVVDSDTGLQGPKSVDKINGLIIPSQNNPSAVILNLFGAESSSTYTFDYRYI